MTTASILCRLFFQQFFYFPDPCISSRTQFILDIFPFQFFIFFLLFYCERWTAQPTQVIQ